MAITCLQVHCPRAFVLSAALTLAACSSSSTNNDSAQGASGGAASAKSGGSTAGVDAAVAGTGGSTASSGGSTTSTGGSTVSSGGITSLGGSTAAVDASVTSDAGADAPVTSPGDADAKRVDATSSSGPAEAGDATGQGCSGGSLLANGSFEAPLVPSGNYTLFSNGQDISGWTVVGAAGNVAPVSTTFVQNGFAFEAQDGAQWLDLTGISNTATGVSQQVHTAAGVTYELSFWVGNVVNPGGIFDTSSTVIVLVNGVQIEAAQNSDGSGETEVNWKQFVVQFKADSDTTTIEFRNGDPSSDTNNGLDNVVLQACTGAGVGRTDGGAGNTGDGGGDGPDGAKAALVLGTFTHVRSPDWSFSESAELATARATLESAFSITWRATDDLTALATSDAQGVILGSGASDYNVSISVLSSAEQTALASYVNAGHFAIILTDNDGFHDGNESLAMTFGLTTSGTLGNLQTATVTQAHAITAGLTTFPLWWPGSVSGQSTKSTVLATTSLGTLLMVFEKGALAPGSGVVIEMADTSPFLDSVPFGVTPEGVALTEKLLLNMVHYASGL